MRKVLIAGVMVAGLVAALEPSLAGAGSPAATTNTSSAGNNSPVKTWGRTFSVPTSVTLSDTAPVVQTQAGNEAGYVLLGDGTVWAWGLNNQGELGNGTFLNSRSVAVQVQFPPGTFITSIGEAFDSAMAIDSQGNVWGWGNGAQGMLCGNPDSTVPELVLGFGRPVTAIAGGSDHYLFLLDNGRVRACGSNVADDLGNPFIGSYSNTPVQVKNLINVVQISAGSHVSGAVDASGNVWMWGQGQYGQMGNGSFSSAPLPVEVDLPGPSSELSVGGSVDTNGSECAMSMGTAYCWGNDTFSQLGDGGTTSSAVPVPVSGVSNVVSVYAGGQASYALTASGGLYAWGANTAGQIGSGSQGGVQVNPMLVDTGVTQFSATDNTVEDSH
jgi:alpha-tubulin suppressor-like RCC1 family protein